MEQQVKRNPAAIGPNINQVSPRVLKILLQDKATGKNIVWATDDYAGRGGEYAAEREILPELIVGPNARLIQPRVNKSQEEQSSRTRQKAEVFTPLSVCQKMCDHAHEALSGQRSWKRYVDARVLEITCGEAPFLTSPYDAATGEAVPRDRRVGLLDRKLCAVDKNAADEAEWLSWALRAVQAVYGYEYQGDSLLLARLNVLAAYADALRNRWGREPTPRELEKAANVIAWNLWQMDGLKYAAPTGSLADSIYCQLSLFPQALGPPDGAGDCKVFDWRKQRSFSYTELVGRERGTMKFDFVIGNPPYQEETESASTRMPPLYHKFMEESYKLAKGVVLITPARFLFNAGYTPKAWNEKMLNDTHFSVLFYEADSSKVFANTDIKGGVCISYHDESKEYGAITTFTKYNELNHILKKVKSKSNNYLSQIVSSPLNFQLTDLAKKENPNLIDRLRSSAFSNLASIFSETKPNDSHPYICMIGLLNGRRVRRFVRRDYIREISNTLDKYTLLLSKANGAGQFGEILSEPEIAEPGVGYTQTFIAFGAFETEQEATNVKKYIHTKFVRAMLGVLKITQDCPGPKWAYVPLQDFTPASDIDWTRSIPEIDRQLYAKYGLDEKEIAFIESHVKEMA